MDAITFTIPIPGELCDPNKRTKSLHLKAKHIAKAREDGGLAASAEKMRKKRAAFPWLKARTEIRWFHPTKRFRDVQNIIATLKATFDGIEDAGIVVNDNDIDEWKVDRQKDANDPRVEITLIRKDA